MNDIDKILGKIDKAEPYDGTIKPIRAKQTLTDEDLLKIFDKLKNKWWTAKELNEILGSKMKINTESNKRTAIGSNYLTRLSKTTGKKWRQQRGFDTNGNTLTRIYILK